MTQKITLDHIDRLATQGHLTAATRLEARQACRDDTIWLRWAGYGLVSLAIGHLLTAIVFFFAFNWAAMSGTTKLTLIGAGLVMSTLGFALLRPQALFQQIAGIAATVFTGVLFAVIGQIYQTGADAWQLFALWTALSLPFMLIARNAVHSLLWLVIANTAWLTFTAQYAEPLDWFAAELSLTIAGLAFIAVLIGREVLVQRFGQSWLDYAWTRVLTVIAVIGHLGVVTAMVIVEPEDTTTGRGIGAAGFCIACVTIVLYYGKNRAGFAAACLGAAALTAMVGTLLIRILIEITDAVEVVLVLGTAGNLALLALFARWLKKRWRALQPGADAPQHGPTTPTGPNTLGGPEAAVTP